MSSRSPLALGLISTALFMNSMACRTVTGTDAELSRERPKRELLPSFAVEEWKKHTSGPALAPYIGQDQLYEMTFQVPELPQTKDKLQAKIIIKDAKGNTVTEARAKVNARGFTSFDFPKKQYSISITNDKGEDDKIAWLGLSKAEDWVLSAPYNDKSLLRDIFTYAASNQLGRHAPNTRIVSLIMEVPDQEPRRMGVYVLTEKNTFGKGRIDIEKKDKQGNTAYQAAFDHYHDGDNVVWRGRETELILEYPAADKITEKQTEAFMTIFQDVEDRITASSGSKWDSLFADRLDLDSAVDFFISQELGRNADGYRLSSGIYIPIGGKIHFGPLWDFNLAYGNATHENGVQWKEWRAKENGIWFGYLMDHPEFCKAAKSRWTAARADGRLSNTTLFAIIDSNAEIMSPIVDENFKTWGGLGRYLWPNPYYLNSWPREVSALKSWIALRTQWMDQSIQSWTCQVKTVELNEANSGTDVPREEEQKFRVPERIEPQDAE